jgi:hypothetical protein
MHAQIDLAQDSVQQSQNRTASNTALLLRFRNYSLDSSYGFESLGVFKHHYYPAEQSLTISGR